MINFGLFTQLKALLAKLSELTPLLKTSFGAYWQKSIEYLNELQEFSDKYSLYFSSDIALAASKLLTFSEDKQGSVAVKRNTRKEKDKFAVTCLESIHKEIKSHLEQTRIAFEECANIWRQVLVQAMGKGLLANLPNGDEKLDFIISAVKKDPEIMPYYMHILGSLGVYNTRAVLDTVLPDLQI